MVMVNEQAPDFDTEAYIAGDFKHVKLKDFKGKWVVLFFYPLDFTFVCPTEIRGFAKAEAEFKKLNCAIVGASTDSVHSHKAWFERDLPEVQFPVLADTNHKLSRAYGVLKEDEGVAFRGTFIINPEGYIKYVVISDMNVGRSVDETLRVVQALQSGGLCPIDWHPGQKTVGK